MSQTRKHSLLESVVGTAIGYFIATGANLIVLPWFGYQVSISTASSIGIIFTGISIARGYLVRRLFNLLYEKELL